MKITKDRLKQIIKEELEVKGIGRHDEMHGGDYQVDPDGYEGRMAKGNLFKIAEYAQSLHDLIGDDENLEPWVEEKIAVAAYMMDSVGHYLQYEKHAGHEASESPEEEYLEISSGEEDEVEYEE